MKETREEVNISQHPNVYPKKMILKHGVKHFLLNTDEIMFCYSSNKVVYIVDEQNQKYVYDKNLVRLEGDLDPNRFFKANRTQIINFNFIRSFVTHEKNKIKVELKNLHKEQAIIVAQTRVNAFRQWVYKQL